MSLERAFYEKGWSTCTACNSRRPEKELSEGVCRQEDYCRRAQDHRKTRKQSPKGKRGSR